MDNNMYELSDKFKQRLKNLKHTAIMLTIAPILLAIGMTSDVAEIMIISWIFFFVAAPAYTLILLIFFIINLFSGLNDANKEADRISNLVSTHENNIIDKKTYKSLVYGNASFGILTFIFSIPGFILALKSSERTINRDKALKTSKILFIITIIIIICCILSNLFTSN